MVFNTDMKIKVAQKIDKNAVPVFVLKEKQRPDSHAFFKLLLKSDQQNLRLFTDHLHEEGGYEHVMLLSSGRRVFIFGVPEGFNHRKSLRLMRRVIAVARKERVSKIALNLNDFNILRLNPDKLAEVLATQLELANFEFVQYKEKPKKGWFFVKETQIYESRTHKIEEAIRRGQIIGEEINNTRLLANTPGGDMTPRKLAEAARKVGRKTGFKVKVFKEDAIRKLKMGGVLGVSRGSNERPRFIIMEYLKGKRGEKPVVLVGKGVTFDTGGLNLKPGDNMYEMHMDMSGGAAVIHTLAALARLKVKKNIIGLVPAVENMPSGSSYRPGDLLRTMSGKTVEVLNTDAEGRIILADALEYSKRYKPRLIIDVATLTSAALVALGQHASAIFATDEKVSQQIQKAGELVGDFVWPLPLWEDYEEEVKGTFGDVANVGKTKYGGAIAAAMFLWQFIKGYPWVHLDIAPRMTTIESENLAKGAAGASVALLTRFLRDF